MSKVCKKLKSKSEFYKNKTSVDGLQRYCSRCTLVSSKEYYRYQKETNGPYLKKLDRRTKEFEAKIVNVINKFKALHGCIFCLEKEAICIDFHHLDNKEVNISRLVHSKSFKGLLQEIGKCVLICSNCHRKLHAGILLINGKNPIDIEYFVDFVKNNWEGEKLPRLIQCQIEQR